VSVLFTAFYSNVLYIFAQQHLIFAFHCRERTKRVFLIISFVKILGTFQNKLRRILGTRRQGGLERHEWLVPLRGTPAENHGSSFHQNTYPVQACLIEGNDHRTWQRQRGGKRPRWIETKAYTEHNIDSEVEENNDLMQDEFTKKRRIMLSPGQADSQVVASSRKLNLRRDLRRVTDRERTRKFPRKYTQVAKKNYFKATGFSHILYFIG